MSKRSSKYVYEEYESDGGFVEDAPKSKKQKKELSGGVQKDDDGNEYWEVRALRSMCARHCFDTRLALWQTPRSDQRIQG